jgi:hypothetical protein
MTDLDAARAELERRQGAVLDALLAGEVPAGFDPVTTRAAGAQLRGKRRYEAAQAVPVLAALPDFRGRFDAWARTGPRAGCAGEDAAAFVAALAAEGPLPRPLSDWWRLEQVRAGRRRVTFVQRAGRRELAVGLGRWTWHLALRRERDTDL